MITAFSRYINMSPLCILCHTLTISSSPLSRSPLCGSCRSAYTRWSRVSLSVKSADLIVSDLIVYSYLEYTGPLKTHLLYAKYNPDLNLMTRLSDTIDQAPPLKDLPSSAERSRLFGLLEVNRSPPALMIPIPPRRAEPMSKGFSPTFLLSHHLSRYIKAEVKLKGLKRRRSSPTQAGLTRADRLIAQRDTLTAHHVAGAHVILVDDVSTTGATLIEAQRACRSAGALSVQAVTLFNALR
jgi:predicted amidophosphoribosyltransferase